MAAGLLSCGIPGLTVHAFAACHSLIAVAARSLLPCRGGPALEELLHSVIQRVGYLHCCLADRVDGPDALHSSTPVVGIGRNQHMLV